MREYEYHGYIIKQERRQVEGLVWCVYKNGNMIGWDNREAVVKEIADWDAQYK